MMKRLLIILLVALGAATEAGAVLKEKDLEQTLTILQAELEQYNNELTVRSVRRQERTKTMITQLLLTLKQADQNALMLYSQQTDNVFDMTYACQEATKQYREFHKRQLPFALFLEKNQADLARYDSIIIRLESMPDMMTTKYGSNRRDSCLTLARNIRNTLARNQQMLKRNIRYYNQAEQRLSELNNYAQKRYTDIQQSIFINGGDSYPTLLSSLGRRWSTMTETVKKKYTTNNNDNSQWSAQWIFGMFIGIAIYIILAIVLNLLFFRFLMPPITMATTTITFALIQGLQMGNSTQNFLIMASNLLVEYAWLLGVILISLLLRVKGDQIGSAFRIYAPLIAMGFIVIGFRIILIPNELVNIVLPPILLACAIWQWVVIRRHNKNIPKSDIFYTYVLLLMVGLYTAGRTTAHLVDHATDVHPDHHLHQPLSGTLRHQETVQRQAGDADLALQFHRESGDACTERKLGDAEHLLGRKGV